MGDNARFVGIVVGCLVMGLLFQVYMEGGNKFETLLRETNSGRHPPAVGVGMFAETNATAPSEFDELLGERHCDCPAVQAALNGTTEPNEVHKKVVDEEPVRRTKGQPLRIAVMTIVTPGVGIYRWMWPMSYSTKKFYCERMGYDLIIGGVNDIEKQRAPHWAKITNLIRWLPLYDYIFWVDVDTMFTRMDLPLESLFVPTFDIIMARDWNNLNSGVFAVRNSTFSMKFLHEVLKNRVVRIPPWQEQSSILMVLEAHKDYLRRFYFPPQRLLNSYPGAVAQRHKEAQWEFGDFIAHTPGCHGMPTCQSIFSETFKQVSRAWGVPLVSKPPTAQYPRNVSIPPMTSFFENEKPEAPGRPPPPPPVRARAKPVTSSKPKTTKGSQAQGNWTPATSVSGKVVGAKLEKVNIPLQEDGYDEIAQVTPAPTTQKAPPRLKGNKPKTGAK